MRSGHAVPHRETRSHRVSPHRPLAGRAVGAAIGGYAGGIITRDHLGYDGYQCGVAVLESNTVGVDLFIEHGLNQRGEHTVGRDLGAQIRRGGYNTAPASSTCTTR